MWLLPSVLIVLAVAAYLTSNRSASGAAAVLLANWGLCALFYAVSGDPTNWMSLAAFDYLAAMALALFMERRWQIVVVALYAVMLCGHVAYSLNALDYIQLSARSYFLSLTVLAWTQAATVGGWILADYLAARRASDPSRSAPPVAAVRREMGGEP